MFKRGRKGQVTLFVIIAIVIIALVVFALVFLPQLKSKKATPKVEPLNPEAYIASCINDVLEPSVELLAKQGGYVQEQLGMCVFHEDFCRTYLCYTTQSNSMCYNTEPLLKERVEQELKNNLTATVQNCIESFVSGARNKGYEVVACDNPVFSVNVSEGKVSVPITCVLSLTKGQDTKKFETFEPSLSWPLFEFVMLANRIILYEQTTGPFDYSGFMNVPANRWIEINVWRQGENTKIYILKERVSEKEFGFALIASS